jgi:NADPH:quinone reductase-like Zn-dependent oxidoreductase
MRAAIFHEFGDPQVVRIEEVAAPEPGPLEVLIAVRAVALNHLDLWVRRGLPVETSMPHIGGSDIAGVVAEVGPGVSEVAVGTRVVVDPTLACGHCPACVRGDQPLCPDFRIIGEHTQGGFAEKVVAPARNLFVIPEDYPFERAAAAPLSFLTAWRGLVTRGRLRRDECVLITGASGGVATAALQIARWTGARAFALTTAEHAERVRSLGAEVVIDRTTVDFARALWLATAKRGFDLIFDSVGQALWRTNIRSLARGGRLVTYGATAGASAETEIRHVFWKQLEIIGTTMAGHAEFEAVMRLVFAGELDPVIDVVWPLERAAEAHERLEKGEQFGKIVLVP